MLNVLVSKTLEQSLMEVQEEAELETLKKQREQYEQIRNANLILAQRMESTEFRLKQEQDRRRT
jgi:hypothetical protein